MAGVNNSLTLGVGNISNNEFLGKYYQNISPAIVHITDGIFANLDAEGIPYCINGKEKTYSIVAVIQYGLMCYDLFLQDIDVLKNRNSFQNCINWLEQNKNNFKDSVVWRSEARDYYNLPEGWISGMYQGQAISIYLRAYQLFGEASYLDTAEKIYNSFKYDYNEGGFKRIDNQGCIWFEEYPSSTPSYVLNGYIYAIFGIYDLYRVSKRDDVKELWESCVHTIEVNLPKYDVWYWSVYDQLKEQLVSFYYQKNVHIPLMKIMYLLTEKEIFNKYAIKWEHNLNNPIHRFITKIMYRIQPRIKKLKSKKR
jgi:heparosan-N-sulfate-glucuronate 5-epimerase